MTENSELKIGGILLAAGGSSRFGRPKQLLVLKGKTLISRAAETLVSSKCDPIVVILGAEIDRSAAEIDGLDVNICINTDWQTGMSSSIISGLRSLLEIEPELDAVVITLCDQPFVTSTDINKLIEAYEPARPSIVGASYGETIGVPALFSNARFADLLQLEGDKGARDVIRNSNNVISVSIDSARNDIDRAEDVLQ